MNYVLNLLPKKIELMLKQLKEKFLKFQNIIAVKFWQQKIVPIYSILLMSSLFTLVETAGTFYMLQACMQGKFYKT